MDTAQARRQSPEYDAAFREWEETEAKYLAAKAAWSELQSQRLVAWDKLQRAAAAALEQFAPGGRNE
jgi:hypothetical protein